MSFVEIQYAPRFNSSAKEIAFCGIKHFLISKLLFCDILVLFPSSFYYMLKPQWNGLLMAGIAWQKVIQCATAFWTDIKIIREGYPENRTKYLSKKSKKGGFGTF